MKKYRSFKLHPSFVQHLMAAFAFQIHVQIGKHSGILSSFIASASHYPFKFIVLAHSTTVLSLKMASLKTTP